MAQFSDDMLALQQQVTSDDVRESLRIFEQRVVQVAGSSTISKKHVVYGGLALGAVVASALAIKYWPVEKRREDKNHSETSKSSVALKGDGEIKAALTELLNKRYDRAKKFNSRLVSSGKTALENALKVIGISNPSGKEVRALNEYIKWTVLSGGHYCYRSPVLDKKITNMVTAAYADQKAQWEAVKGASKTFKWEKDVACEAIAVKMAILRRSIIGYSQDIKVLLYPLFSPKQFNRFYYSMMLEKLGVRIPSSLESHIDSRRLYDCLLQKDECWFDRRLESDYLCKDVDFSFMGFLKIKEMLVRNGLTWNEDKLREIDLSCSNDHLVKAVGAKLKDSSIIPGRRIPQCLRYLRVAERQECSELLHFLTEKGKAPSEMYGVAHHLKTLGISWNESLVQQSELPIDNSKVLEAMLIAKHPLRDDNGNISTFQIVGPQEKEECSDFLKKIDNLDFYDMEAFVAFVKELEKKAEEVVTLWPRLLKNFLWAHRKKMMRYDDVRFLQDLSSENEAEVLEHAKKIFGSKITKKDLQLFNAYMSSLNSDEEASALERFAGVNKRWREIARAYGRSCRWRV